MFKQLYHYVSTAGLLQYLEEDAIEPVPFQTCKVPGLCPHILLSSNPHCDRTANAILRDVYGEVPNGDEQEPQPLTLYRIAVSVPEVLPWKTYKRQHGFTCRCLIEEEQECYGTILDQYLQVYTESISIKQWNCVEEWRNEKWCPLSPKQLRTLPEK